ncbi:MAG: FAD binding domain-containing protein [Methyloligellaceae bacterium]
MKPPPFQYHDPKRVEEALELLTNRENAKVLAGGQSLMAMLNMRYVQPDHIVDINGIEDLSYIRSEDDTLHIGAMTRQREVEFSALIAERCPLMHEAILQVGHRQTRNRGTVGGSLCHLDPAAELPGVAMALDATIEVQGPDGRRDVPMAEFPAFFMTPAIAANEIVTGLRFDVWPDGHGSAFIEFSRRHGDFAIVAVAALLQSGSDGTIERAAVTLSGTGPAPIRVAKAEASLVGSDGAEDALLAAASASAELEAIGDPHASADYRRHLAKTLTLRALTSAYQRSTGAHGDRTH